jgi:glycosyltransferase involved in cell wall biosynthesis
MRIGIEVTQLFHELQTGLYYYSLHLLRSMAKMADSHRITLFTSSVHSRERWQEIAEHCRPLEVRQFRSPGRPYRLRMALDPISRQDVLFYVMGQIAPPAANRVNAFLVPDLTPLHDPRWHTDANRYVWLEQYELIQQHADVVITFSEHTKRDVVEHLGIPAETIHAIPLAAAEHFRPLEDRAELERELAAINLTPGGYILSVGTLEPRKNHVRLLRAFQRLRESGRDADQLLVLAGPLGWHYEAIFAEIERLGLQAHVRHLGHFPRLDVLLSGATVMAYPSVFEGFGLPPLEAMACGTPVLAANTTSLPEVVGDAGVLVDPHDEEQIADALGSLLGDAGRREKMRRAGLARAREFSWERTARSTLDVLQRAVNERYGRKRSRSGAAVSHAVLH